MFVTFEMILSDYYKPRLIILAVWCWQAEAEMQEQSLISYYQKTKQRDHQNMLQRKFIIEQRKEQLEHLNQERVSRPLTNISLNHIDR